MPSVDMLVSVRDGPLDQTDALQGLTAKQLKFCRLSFSGLSDAEAYRQAYDAEGMSDESVGKAAHILAHNPKVQSKLRELRLELDRQTTLAPLLNREFVINGVMQLAVGASKEAVRLRAYELLGKTVGIDLFRETVVRETRQRTVEDVDRELKERLSALAPLIEGEAREVEKPADRSPRVNDRRRKPRT